MKNLNFFEGEKGAKRIRYVISSLIISAMVCFASILDNKEAIFPEVAATDDRMAGHGQEGLERKHV